MNSPKDIIAVRDQIDQLDTDLLALVNQRIDLAREIGRLKDEQTETASEKGDISKEKSPQYYRPEREAQVLRRLKAENSGRLKDEQIEGLFREVMSICRGAEGKLTVAALGPEGTFSEQAARQQFGTSVEVQLFSTIEEVFSVVESNVVDFAVVPIENSTGGSVTLTADRLVSTSARITGEIYLPIHQMLLAKAPNIDFSTIKRIYSHAQSISQCHRWIARHLPKAVLMPVSSNAEAAKLASSDVESVALAGEMAAKQYGLNVIEKNIEDEPNNMTRFLVLSNQDVAPSGKDKTSILFSTRNQSGALYGLLEPLRQNGLSMTRIESRPSRLRRWEYVFFVDVEGHHQDANVTKALAEIEQAAGLYSLLGSYPSAG